MTLDAKHAKGFLHKLRFGEKLRWGVIAQPQSLKKSF